MLDWLVEACGLPEVFRHRRADGSTGEGGGVLQDSASSGTLCAILAARHDLYLQARQRNPARWSGDTRNWSPIGTVTLNPERDAVVNIAVGGQHTQQKAA